MLPINLKKEVKGSVNQILEKVQGILQSQGFGVLTRIDFHAKIKEKLGKEINTEIILGACNPQIAYQAYQMNSDVTSLMPCNVVIRDLGSNRCSVEIASAEALLSLLPGNQLSLLGQEVDKKLEMAFRDLQ